MAGQVEKAIASIQKKQQSKQSYQLEARSYPHLQWLQ